jgi:glycosyltransferase involved in cell wall biosynthesis
METPLPLVTIITPTYNRANYLPETIESVLSQDYSNIEYIVLDDGSKDNTLEVLRQYDSRVIIETHENIGETKTVNRGLRKSKGEFICVVNSDDPLLPGAIKTIVLAMIDQPDGLAAYPDWLEIDSQSKPLKEMILPDYEISNMLSEFNVSMGPGTFFRRSVLEKFGFRDEERKYTGDLEFWFRLAANGNLIHVSKILATHRSHSNSASVSEKSSKISEELLSLIKSSLYSGLLPKEILKKQNRLFSQAYFKSIFYCNKKDLKKMLIYTMRSFFYDPRLFIINIMKLFLGKHSTLFLQNCLQEEQYQNLQSLWRNIKKNRS